MPDGDESDADQVVHDLELDAAVAAGSLLTSTPPPPPPPAAANTHAESELAAHGEARTMTRPKFLGFLLELLEYSLTVYVVLTRELRPAYTTLSTTGGMVVTACVVLFYAWMTARNTRWQRFINNQDVARTISLMIALTSIGIFTSAVSALYNSAAMDCVGILIVFLFRPTEPSLTATVTYSPEPPQFTWQVRLRKIGMCCGVIIGQLLSLMVWSLSSDGGEVRMALFGSNTIIFVAYCAIWIWLWFMSKRPESYRALVDTSQVAAWAAGLMPHTDDLNRVLADVRTSLTATEDEKAVANKEKVKWLETHLRALIVNGFFERLSELLLLGTIFYYTGMGRTGDSSLAIGLVMLVALLILVSVNFSLDSWKWIHGMRIGAGLAMIVLAGFVHMLDINRVELGVEGTELVWSCVCASIFFVLITGGDQPYLDVSRFSLSKYLKKRPAAYNPAMDPDFRKTISHLSLQATSSSEVVAFVIFIALIPLGWAAVTAVYVVVAAFLVSSTVSAMAMRRSVIFVYDELRVRPRSAALYATQSVWRTICVRTGRPNAGAGGGSVEERGKFQIISDEEEKEHGAGGVSPSNNGPAPAAAAGGAIHVEITPIGPAPSAASGAVVALGVSGVSGIDTSANAGAEETKVAAPQPLPGPPNSSVGDAPESVVVVPDS
jgi:hypothetical protein